MDKQAIKRNSSIRQGSFWKPFSSGDAVKPDDTNSQIPNLRQKSTKMTATAPPAPANLDRSQLQEYLAGCSADPDLMSVVQLGRKCLTEGTEGLGAGTHDMTYYGAILMEWANFRGADVSLSTNRLLANAHYESWLTRGVVGEVEHLTYARASFEKALNDSSLCSDSTLWLEYSKVLMHLGESDQGLKTMTTMIRRFDGHQNMSLFYLTAGAMLSAMGQYEKAGQYFFDCIQHGLPKYFSKSDLMFVLSRSIEQLGFETKTTASDPVEDGYVMVIDTLYGSAALTFLQVFNNMVSESAGTLDNELTYDDWISDFTTWRDIADKCALHGLFSLAADLYGQGLVRDRSAFVKSSLWFRFAKSCFRCGRTSDAQLAVKQAVTLDPGNAQCTLALKSWSVYSTVLVDLVEGPLCDILTMLPEPKSRPDAAARLIQAFYRGQQTRHVMKSRLTYSTRRELLKNMKASAGLIVGDQHPLLLSVRPNWKAEVHRIHFYDIKSNKNGLILMKYPFRIPLKRFDPSYSYRLLMSCGCLDETEGSEKLYLVTISFRELETGFYVMRQVYLTLDVDGNLSISESTVDVVHPARRNVTQIVGSADDGSCFTKQSDDISTLDRLYTRVGAYHARRGVCRYFGNLFLYKASLVTSGYHQKVAATPSATAFKAANHPSPESAIRIKLLQLSTDQRFCFVLPPLLSTLQNVSDVLSVLLLGVKCMRDMDTYVANKEAIIDDIELPLLTPQNDTISIYNGKLQILMREVGIDNSGAMVIAVDDYPVEGSSSDFMERVKLILRIYTRQDDAWLFLQDKVSEALDYDVVAPEDMSEYSSFQDTVRTKDSGSPGTVGPPCIDSLVVQEAVVASSPPVLPEPVTEGSEKISESLPMHSDVADPPLVDQSSELSESVVIDGSDVVPEDSSVHSDVADPPMVDQFSEMSESVVIDGCDVVPEDSSVHSDVADPPLVDQSSEMSESVVIDGSDAVPEDSSVHSDVADPPLVDQFSEVSESVVIDGCDVVPEDSSVHSDVAENTKVSEVIDSGQDAGTISAVAPIWLHVKGPFRYHGQVILYKSAVSGNKQYNITTLDVENDCYTRFVVSGNLLSLQNVSDVLSVLLLGVKCMRDMDTYVANKEAIIDDIELPLLTPQNDTISIYNGKLQILMREVGIDNSGAMVIAVDDYPVEGSSSDFMERVKLILRIYTRQDDAWLFLQDKVSAAKQSDGKIYKHDPDKEKAYEAIKLSDEIEEEHLPFVYHAPEVDHNNISMLHMEEMSDVSEDPYSSMEGLVTYRSSIAPLEERQPVNVQAAFFLAFQVQRLEALDYLADRSTKAKHQVGRREAFKYLCERTRAAVANPVPPAIKVSAATFLLTPTRPVADEVSLCIDNSTPPNDDAEKDKTSPPKPHNTCKQSTSNRPALKADSTRRGSVPSFPIQSGVGRRRQSLAVPRQFSKDEVENPLETKLQSLLDEKLKNDKFAENPGELVDVLQSFIRVENGEGVSEDHAKSPMTNADMESQNSADNVDIFPLRKSSILATLPLQKVHELETKMATIGSIHRLNTTGKGRRNPVDFLESHICSDEDALLRISEPMFDESILNFLHMGYSSGTCAYLAIWKSKLRQCLRSFSSAAQLDKALHSLQRAYPEPLTRAGAFCALAETGGSIGEALGQLNDKTFKHELVLVCQALPVDDIIQRLADHMKKSKVSNNDPADGEYGTGRNSPNVAEIMRPTMIMRSDSGPDFPTKNDITASSAPKKAPTEGQDFPSHASRTLPNFGMKSNSSTVRSRGTVVRRLKSSTSEQSLSASCFFPPIASATPSLHSARQSFSKSAPCQTTSAVNEYRTAEYASNSAPRTVTQKSNAILGHSGTAPPKYNRMGKTIDNLAEETDSLVVMSRLEAYRAQQETRLLKYHPSDSSYYRSSRQRKTMRRTQKSDSFNA